MMSHNCIVASCFKLRNQKFFLKQISLKKLELENPCKITEEAEETEQFEVLNIDFPRLQFDLLEPWTDMLPQLPQQNVLQCYGITRIKERYYFICDLVQDN